MTERDLQNVKVRQQGLHDMPDSLFSSDTHAINPKSTDKDCLRAECESLFTDVTVSYKQWGVGESVYLEHIGTSSDTCRM